MKIRKLIKPFIAHFYNIYAILSKVSIQNSKFPPGHLHTIWIIKYSQKFAKINVSDFYWSCFKKIPQFFFKKKRVAPTAELSRLLDLIYLVLAVTSRRQRNKNESWRFSSFPARLVNHWAFRHCAFNARFHRVLSPITYTIITNWNAISFLYCHTQVRMSLKNVHRGLGIRMSDSKCDFEFALSFLRLWEKCFSVFVEKIFFWKLLFIRDFSFIVWYFWF